MIDAGDPLAPEIRPPALVGDECQYTKDDEADGPGCNHHDRLVKWNGGPGESTHRVYGPRCSNSCSFCPDEIASNKALLTCAKVCVPSALAGFSKFSNSLASSTPPRALMSVTHALKVSALVDKSSKCMSENPSPLNCADRPSKVPISSDWRFSWVTMFGMA